MQSFAPGDDAPTDADVLAAATGEDPFTVCPPHRCLARAMAPPMAAEALGLPPFSVADLADEVRATAPGDAVVLVESAGGVRSPLASDGDTVALADALRPALVLLVADAGLGTINLVRLSADALGDHPVVVYLNRYDARHRAPPRATPNGSRRARASRSSPTPRPCRHVRRDRARYWLIRRRRRERRGLAVFVGQRPTASCAPAAASYWMSWNVSPMNQSSADVVHVESGQLQPPTPTLRRACGPPPSPTRGRASSADSRVFTSNAAVVQP